jgi:hypothetical protein
MLVDQRAIPGAADWIQASAECIGDYVCLENNREAQSTAPGIAYLLYHGPFKVGDLSLA